MRVFQNLFYFAIGNNNTYEAIMQIIIQIYAITCPTFIWKDKINILYHTNVG